MIQNTYTFVFILIDDFFDIRYLIPNSTLSLEDKDFLKSFECGNIDVNDDGVLDYFYTICGKFELSSDFFFDCYIQ